LGRDPDAERILRDGLEAAPKNALLHHAIGLALVRLKRTDAALIELERAAALDPSNARFAYVHGVALHSAGKIEAAISRLKETLRSHPNDPDVLQALASFHAGRGEGAEAKKYAERLRALEASTSSQ
jgi:predicted Zn-dependent protease